MEGKIIKMAHNEPGPAAQKFKRGDVVALNSGGVALTIRGVKGDMVEVDWITEDGTPYSSDFFHDMLVAPAREEQ